LSTLHVRQVWPWDARRGRGAMSPAAGGADGVEVGGACELTVASRSGRGVGRWLLSPH
jgi:hypothetical protein